MVTAPAILVLIVLVVVLATRRHRENDRFVHAPNLSRTSPRRREPTGLERTLAEWQEQGLLRADEVQPILLYEERKAAPRSRVPLAAEAVGYVGSALVFAAIALLIGRRWDEIAVAGRIAVLAIPAAAFAAAGWWVGTKHDEAFERMGSVLWALSSAALAGTLTVVFVDAFYDGDPPEHGGLLFVSGIVAVWAAVQYALRRLPLQQAVLFASLLVAALGVVNLLEAARDDGFSATVWGLTAFGVGAAWTALGVTRRLEPSEVARVLGPVALLLSAQTVRGDATVFGLWLGFTTAVLLVAVAVWRADLILLLTGALGLFQWSPQIAIHYLADTIGTEATLLIVGLLLIASATVFTRLYRQVRADATDDENSTLA